MIVFGGSDGHASFADVHVLNLSKSASERASSGNGRGDGGEEREDKLISRKLSLDNSYYRG